MSGNLQWFRIEGIYPRAGVSGPWLVQALSTEAARRHAEALGIHVTSVTLVEGPEGPGEGAVSTSLVLMDRFQAGHRPGAAPPAPLDLFSTAMCPCGQTESLLRVRKSLRRWGLPFSPGMGEVYVYFCPQCAGYLAYEEQRKFLNRLGCLALVAVALAALTLLILN